MSVAIPSSPVMETQTVETAPSYREVTEKQIAERQALFHARRIVRAAYRARKEQLRDRIPRSRLTNIRWNDVQSLLQEIFTTDDDSVVSGEEELFIYMNDMAAAAKDKSGQPLAPAARSELMNLLFGTDAE